MQDKTTEIAQTIAIGGLFLTSGITIAMNIPKIPIAKAFVIYSGKKLPPIAPKIVPLVHPMKGSAINPARKRGPTEFWFP